MTDELYNDERLARVYDVFYDPASRPDLPFYLDLAMAAHSVLDVGCGTGAFLHRVRDGGHRGRLCGLDPGPGMLAQARERADVEWVLGDLSTVSWREEFDVVVMTGHALQVLVTDEQPGPRSRRCGAR